MCIIVYKPEGEQMPERETLKNCFDNNPDGAGIMYIEAGEVQIRKGYMSFDNFYADLQTIPMHGPVVLHFRIATAGLTKPGNCHPFPLSNRHGDLQAINYRCQVGIVHNGCIPITDSKYKNLSDTMIFIRDCLYPWTWEEIKHNKLIIDLAGHNSKFLFLHFTGEVEMVGDFIEKEGVYYSNKGFEAAGLTKWGSLWSKKWDSKAWDDIYNEYDGIGNKAEDKEAEAEGEHAECAFCGAIIPPEEEATIALFEGDLVCENCMEFCKN